MSNAVEYQAEMDVEGMHESWHAYPKHINQLMNHFRDTGIHTFRFGFAWQDDESALRHLSCFLNPLPDSVFLEYEDSTEQLPNDHPIHFANYPEDRRPYVTPHNGCSHSILFSDVPHIPIEGRFLHRNDGWGNWLYAAFNQFEADIDCLWELNVPKRTVEDVDVLYITAPILESNSGESIEWNM